MVVSMRPIPRRGPSAKAVTASARFPGAHGAPIHIGDPAAIGIADITRPDYGDRPQYSSRRAPVSSWACGVTPQAVDRCGKARHSPSPMRPV